MYVVGGRPLFEQRGRERERETNRPLEIDEGYHRRSSKQQNSKQRPQDHSNTCARTFILLPVNQSNQLIKLINQPVNPTFNSNQPITKMNNSVKCSSVKRNQSTDLSVVTVVLVAVETALVVKQL